MKKSLISFILIITIMSRFFVPVHADAISGALESTYAFQQASPPQLKVICYVVLLGLGVADVGVQAYDLCDKFLATHDVSAMVGATANGTLVASKAFVNTFRTWLSLAMADPVAYDLGTVRVFDPAVNVNDFIAQYQGRTIPIKPIALSLVYVTKSLSATDTGFCEWGNESIATGIHFSPISPSWYAQYPRMTGAQFVNSAGQLIGWSQDIISANGPMTKLCIPTDWDGTFPDNSICPDWKSTDGKTMTPTQPGDIVIQPSADYPSGVRDAEYPPGTADFPVSYPTAGTGGLPIVGGNTATYPWSAVPGVIAPDGVISVPVDVPAIPATDGYVPSSVPWVGPVIDFFHIDFPAISEAMDFSDIWKVHFKPFIDLTTAFSHISDVPTDSTGKFYMVIPTAMGGDGQSHCVLDLTAGAVFISWARTFIRFSLWLSLGFYIFRLVDPKLTIH